MQCPKCQAELVSGAKFCSACGVAVSSADDLEDLAALEAIDFSDDIKRLTQGFVGREELFEAVIGWLDQSDDRFFLLSALPGLGKSAFAARLTQHMTSQMLAHHFCIAGRNATVLSMRTENRV